MLSRLVLPLLLLAPGSALRAGPVQAGDALPAALLAQHRSQSRCEPLEELVHGGDAEVHALGGGNVLFMVPCTAGAYNFAYRLYVGNPGGDWFDGLDFADYSSRWGWSGTDVLFLPAFDPETGTLTSFYKGRGLGDCGTWGRWTWDEYAFRLDEFHAKDDCDGNGEPGDFPQVFP